MYLHAPASGHQDPAQQVPPPTHRQCQRGYILEEHRSKAPTLQPEFRLTLQPAAFIRPYVSCIQMENAFNTYGLFLAL